MSCSCRDRSNGGSGLGGNSLVAHMRRFIGSTVTSGGASGSGFTGVLLAVNPDFIRLVTDFGMPPANPLGDELDSTIGSSSLSSGSGSNHCHPVGSVVDIPVNRIAAFNHNAL